MEGRHRDGQRNTLGGRRQGRWDAPANLRDAFEPRRDDVKVVVDVRK
jgi:hypothetical protein